MDVALKALSRRRLSQGQVLLILTKKGFSEEDSKACLAKLNSWGYLDDRALARDLVENMLKECPVGKRRALYELSKRLIDKETAEEIVAQVYSGLTEDDLAFEAAEKYLNGRTVTTVKEYQRLGRWLARQGFGYEAIIRVLRNLGVKDCSAG